LVIQHGRVTNGTIEHPGLTHADLQDNPHHIFTDAFFPSRCLFIMVAPHSRIYRRRRG